MKELCSSLRPGESISIDRSEGGFSIRASLEGKVVFSNHVHLDLLDDARFDLIFQIILDSIAEVRQFRTEQEKHGVQEKVGQSVTLDLEGRQDVDELRTAYRDFQGQEAYREFRERESARRCLLDALTEEQRDRVFASYHGVPPEPPPVDTEVASAYERKAEEMAQAMQQRLREGGIRMSEIKSGDYVVAGNDRLLHSGVPLYRKGDLLQVKSVTQGILYGVTTEGVQVSLMPSEAEQVPMLTPDQSPGTDCKFLYAVQDHIEHELNAVIRRYCRVIPSRLKKEFEDWLYDMDFHASREDRDYSSRQGVPDFKDRETTDAFLLMELERVRDGGGHATTNRGMGR